MMINIFHWTTFLDPPLMMIDGRNLKKAFKIIKFHHFDTKMILFFIILEPDDANVLF